TGKHTVFGKVTKGMEIVDMIGKVKVGAGSKPVEPVTIVSIRLKKAES
ncbi:MAG: peptidylprolyl isomerase, partial [Planctomycetota bacterium]